jgi:hypothetical protein
MLSKTASNTSLHRSCTAIWLQLLVLTSSQVQHFAAAVPVSSTTASINQPIVQQSVPARYCPNGGTMEGGLCYNRCQVGWHGLGCFCWKGVESYNRGCGIKPAICHAMSYRKQLLPPVTSKAPFSLVLSADPQLFRVVNKYKNVSGQLAASAHRCMLVLDMAHASSRNHRACCTS